MEVEAPALLMSIVGTLLKARPFLLESVYALSLYRYVFSFASLGTNLREIQKKYRPVKIGEKDVIFNI